MLFEGEESLFDFVWIHYFYFCFVGQLCRGKTVEKKDFQLYIFLFFSAPIGWVIARRSCVATWTSDCECVTLNFITPDKLNSKLTFKTVGWSHEESFKFENREKEPACVYLLSV